MKKIIGAVIIAATSLFSFAEIMTNGYFRYEYEIKDDGVLIKNVNIVKSLLGEVTLTIPETINGMPVKYIQAWAIAGYNSSAEESYENFWLQVKKVIFPSSFEQVETTWSDTACVFNYNFFQVYDAGSTWHRSQDLTLEFKGKVPTGFVMENWYNDEYYAKLIYPTADLTLRTEWENTFKKECNPIFYTDLEGTLWRDMIIPAQSWTPQTMKYFAALTTSLNEQGKKDAETKAVADALILLLKLNENTTAREMFETLGIQIGTDDIKTESDSGMPGYQNEENYKNYQPNDLVALTMEEYQTFVSAIELLGKVDSSWAGSIVFSMDVLPPLTEDVYFDYADSRILKANLEAMCAASQIANSYNFELDYTKEFIRKINPTAMSAESDTEWAKVPVYSIENCASVQIGQTGTDLLFRVTTIGNNVSYLNAYFDGNFKNRTLQYDSNQASLLHENGSITAATIDINDNVLTFKFTNAADLLKDVTNIEMYYSSSTYWGFGQLATKPITEIISEQPGFAGERKENSAGLAEAEVMANAACETARQAITALEARDDNTIIHLFNLPQVVDLDLIRKGIDKFQASLKEPTSFKEFGLSEEITLMPLFAGTGPVYDNLPEIVNGEFVIGTEKDTTFCGVLPNRQAADLFFEGLFYKIENNQVVITGSYDASPVLTIPNTIAGLPVTTIDAQAFEGNILLEKVVLPSTATTIGANAFSGCTAVTEFVFNGDAPTSVGENAFATQTVGGTTVKYPGAYYQNWRTQFSDGKWNGLTPEVYDYTPVSETWTDVDDVVYTYMDNGDGTAEITKVESATATKIEIPATINGLQIIAIGHGAFVECSNLKDLTIPEGVVYLREGWATGLFDSTFGTLIIPESLSSDSLKMATWHEGGWPANPTTFISYGKPPNLEDSGFSWIPILYYSVKYAEEWEAALKTIDFINIFEEQKICMGNQLHVVPSLFNGGETTQKTKTIGWGETVSITATPYDGFVFLGWGGTLEGVNTTDATISFTMPKKDVILVPNFFPKALIQGWMKEDMKKAVEEEVLKQTEPIKDAAVEAAAPAIKAAAVTEALDNKEVYTKESMKEMAFGQPVMEVNDETVEVAISLESTDNLTKDFSGLDLSGATLEKDETTPGLFRVKVPVQNDTAFYKFVVKDEAAETPTAEEQ